MLPSPEPAFVIERHLPDPPDRVWEGLVRLIGDGLAVVGGEHAFSIDTWHLVERTTVVEPPNRRVYRIVSGAPVSFYEGTTEIVGDETGSTLRWTAVASPAPDAGDSYQRFLERAHAALTRAVDLIVDGVRSQPGL